MKLTIERAALLKSLAHVQSVVERRTTIPILSNVLLECEDGALRLTATDMDIAIVDGAAAEVGLAGAVTVPAQTLYDIVRKLPEGSQVAFDASGESSRLVMRAARSEFTLQTLPKDDFPVMTAGDLSHRFELPAADLRALIDRTKFAISTEETRYYLNGIYLHIAENQGVAVLRAVATDGHRLARVEMPLPDGAAGMPGVIVPRKTVTELRKLLEEASDPISVALSDTKIRFDCLGAVLTSKLIDGTFPEYERVIPVGNDKVMEVDRKSFSEAVDRVATIATEKSRAVKLSLNPGSLTLTAHSPDNDIATEELEIGYTADPLEIGFNSRYLLDIAQQIEGEGAQFVIADGGSPTIVRDGADASTLYVLMPMRV